MNRVRVSLSVCRCAALVCNFFHPWSRLWIARNCTPLHQQMRDIVAALLNNSDMIVQH